MFAVHRSLDIQHQMVELLNVWRSIFRTADEHPYVYYEWLNRIWKQWTN